MNYIILEGITLYIFLIITLLQFLISIGCIICATMSQRRESVIKNLFLNEKEKLVYLEKENFLLRLKSGEFDIDE